MKLVVMTMTRSMLGKPEDPLKYDLAHLKYGRIEKSSIAKHALEADHYVTLDNLRFIRIESDRKLLNSYEL